MSWAGFKNTRERYKEIQVARQTTADTTKYQKESFLICQSNIDKERSVPLPLERKGGRKEK